jgi:hypothetical protein
MNFHSATKSTTKLKTTRPLRRDQKKSDTHNPEQISYAFKNPAQYLKWYDHHPVN